MQTAMAANNGGGGGSRSGCITAAGFIDRASVESYRCFLARRTLLEMLRDRGYSVPDSELGRDFDDFRSTFGHQIDVQRLRFSCYRVDSPKKKILVIFCGKEEIRKKEMVGILLQIENKESLEKLILVLQSKMNSYAKKVAEEYPVKIQTFQITDLLINITKHITQPKLEILNDQEKAKFLKAYNIEANKIPRMEQEDAIAVYYGLEKGQVVKITHEILSASSPMITYRCVV